MYVDSKKVLFHIMMKIYGLLQFLRKVVVFKYVEKELNADYKSAQMTFPNSFVNGYLPVHLTGITTRYVYIHVNNEIYVLILILISII